MAYEVWLETFKVGVVTTQYGEMNIFTYVKLKTYFLPEIF